MISVIVPVYCVEQYLQKCIDSILNQTYRDFEVILIDDGSPDECGKICDSYANKDARVKVIHTDNHGLSAARNVGLSESQGDVICFIDSDDWIDPTMLEVMESKMNEADADICVCGFWFENDVTRKEYSFDYSLCSSNTALKTLVNEKLNGNVWNKLYRRKLFFECDSDKSNYLKDKLIRFPEGKNYEDYYILHRLIKNANKVVTLTESLYHYRLREDSITKTYSAKNLLDYADAHFVRYNFLLNNKDVHDLFSESEILAEPAKGLSKVWRWWYGCSKKEKNENVQRIKDLEAFIRKNLPLFGYKTWPKHLRIASLFMHSSSGISFWIIYNLNGLFRKLRPKDANNLYI